MTSKECNICLAQESTDVKHICKHEDSAREFIARIRDTLANYNEGKFDEGGVMHEVRSALIEFNRQLTNISHEDAWKIIKNYSKSLKNIPLSIDDDYFVKSECDCTSRDLLTFGHKCGRKAPIDG